MAVDSAGPKSLLNQPHALVRRTTPEQQDAKLKDAAKMYERQFLGEMMKAMRGTVQESGFVKATQAEKIFREQLDGEYLDKWADEGGLGLQKIIYQQLIEKYGTQLGIKAPIDKPTGPIALGGKFSVVPTAQDKSGDRLSFVFERPRLLNQSEESAVSAPWAGRVLGVRQLDAENYVMQMQHDNGLKTQLVFRGSARADLAGTQVEAGENLGFLNKDAQKIFWNVENGLKSKSE